METTNLPEITHSAWLSTAASQIFFMQLGFLCLEAGYIKPEYFQSLVIKNIEDIFFGFTTYAIFGFAFYELRADYLVLWNIPFSEWDTIFVNAAFAAAAATIISGAVLERMKNIAYSLWVFLTVSVNYSVISRWAWHPDGWLFKLGFVDCAGCGAVHMIGGIGGFILVIFLGPRYSSIKHKYIGEQMDDEDHQRKQSKIHLKDAHPPNNLLMMIIGVFILWYGWVAFNTSSPIIGGVGIGGDVGLAGLNTVIMPSCASASMYLVSYINWPNAEWVKRRGLRPGTAIVERSAENLSFAILSGLVTVTGCCFTADLLPVIIVGFLCPFPLFFVSYYLRSTFNFDDPLDAIPVHMFGGMLGLFVEGLINFNEGLFTTGNFKHFGVQCLGIVVTLAFNIAMFTAYWFILKLTVFRNHDIKTSPLQVSLGYSKANTYAIDYGLAFKELLVGNSSFARFMILQFHKHLKTTFCDELLDFILAVNEYRKIFNFAFESDGTDQKSLSTMILMTRTKAVSNTMNNEDGNDRVDIMDMEEIIKRVKSGFNCIVELYILTTGVKQINISSEARFKIVEHYNKINNINVGENEKKANDDAQSGDEEEEEQDEAEAIYADKTVFNDAFMETLKHTLTALQLFFQEYHNHPEWKRHKDAGLKKVYKVEMDTYDVKWKDDVEEENNLTVPFHHRRQSTQNYITSSDGKLKSVEEEINEILQTG